MENEQNDLYYNWQTYLSTIDSQLYTMWNFILYKQFNDSEYYKLNNTINTLNTTVGKLTEENRMFELKRSIDCCNDESRKKMKTLDIIPVNRLKLEYDSLHNKKKYNFHKHRYQSIK